MADFRSARENNTPKRHPTATLSVDLL